MIKKTKARVIITIFLILMAVLMKSIPFVFAQGQGAQQPKADTIFSFLSDTGKIIPDIETNSFIVIDYPANIARVEEFLKMADIPARQVLIEAKIVEVKLEREHSLGVNWSVFADKGGFEMGQFRVGSISSTTGELIGLEEQIPYKSTHYPPGDVSKPAESPFTIAIFDENINIVLKALANQLETDMLSAPKISTVNNRRAKIDVIKTIPYVKEIEKEVDQETDIVTYTYVYDYTDEGVSLEATPIINPDESITLLLSPQIKTIVKWHEMPGPDALSKPNLPETDVRVAKTKVKIKNGQTLVIGGLIREKILDGVSKVPFLGDLPLLGRLFSSENKFKQKTELLIFVSATIITPDEFASMARQEKYGPGRRFAEERKRDARKILNLEAQEEMARERAEKFEMQKIYHIQKQEESLVLKMGSLEGRYRILQREKEDLKGKILDEEESIKSLREDKEEIAEKRRQLE